MAGRTMNWLCQIRAKTAGPTRDGIMSLRLVSLLAVLCFAALLPTRLTAQQTVADSSGPDTVRYTPSRGTVTFTHAKHAKSIECSACHHESRTERPYTKPRQACGDCHGPETTPPVTTTLKSAFHNTAERTGLCYDCHKKEVAAGKDTPTACNDCHKR